MGKRQNNMSQLFQFKSATATSIEYAGADYLYIINNTVWTNIDIDTIEFGQLLNIVAKVNAGEIYALRRTRLFDALDVKLGTDVSGNYAPSIAGKISEWNGDEYKESDDLQIRKINVIDSEDVDIVSYDEDQKQLNLDFSELSGSIGLELDSGPGKIKKLVIENDNNNAFSYNDIDNILTFNMGGINGKAGFVCITNITPTNAADNVGSYEYDNSGIAMTSCRSSTVNVDIEVLAITGLQDLKPVVTVNGGQVTLEPYTTENLWKGTISRTLVESAIPGEYLVEAYHSEGNTDTAIVYLETPPTVTVAEYTGTYPVVGQTAYANGRTVGFTVTANKAFTHLEVVANTDCGLAYKALNPPELVAPFTEYTTRSGTGLTIAVPTNNTYNKHLHVRVKNANTTNAWSDVFISAGPTDHTDFIVLDSRLPSVTIDTIDYPGTQQALKDTEQAEVLYTYTNTEQLQVQSIGTDLDIVTPNPGVGDEILVNRKSSGSGYNISSNNLRIIAKKLTNDTSLTVNAIVQIADSVPSITLSGTHTTKRLRSGGNNGTSEPSYAVTIHSNQRLQNIPTLTPGSGGGELTLLPDWTGTNNGDGMQYSGKSLKVHDLLTRGEYEYTISGVLNLAGRTTTTITSGKKYTIGGFVSRNGYFTTGSDFSDIGVSVSNFDNAQKLVVTVLSLPGTYVENTTNVNYSSGNHIFTIVSTAAPTAFEPRGNAIRLNEEKVIGAISTSPGLPYTIEELD